MSFYSWNEIPKDDYATKVRTRIITGEEMMLILVEMDPGAEYVMHHHPHEQFSYVLQGKLNLSLGNVRKLVGPGDVWHVPPNVEHGGTIYGDETVVFLEAFHPIREDVLGRLNEEGRRGALGRVPERETRSPW